MNLVLLALFIITETRSLGDAIIWKASCNITQYEWTLVELLDFSLAIERDVWLSGLFRLP